MRVPSNTPDTASRPAPVAWRVMSGAPNQTFSADHDPDLLNSKFQEGREQGLAEAIAVARRESEAKLQPVLERLVKGIASLDRARDEIRQEVAGDVARLAVAIAGRILHREISIDQDAILGLVIAGFNKLQGKECSRVLVHPDHEPAIRRWLSQLATRNNVEIVGDRSLSPGDVRFETGQGQLDASIPTQLLEIERGLADHIEI